MFIRFIRYDNFICIIFIRFHKMFIRNVFHLVQEPDDTCHFSGNHCEKGEKWGENIGLEIWHATNKVIPAKPGISWNPFYNGVVAACFATFCWLNSLTFASCEMPLLKLNLLLTAPCPPGPPETGSFLRLEWLTAHGDLLTFADHCSKCIHHCSKCSKSCCERCDRPCNL